MQQHLRRCNGRPRPTPTYFSPDANTSDGAVPDEGGEGAKTVRELDALLHGAEALSPLAQPPAPAAAAAKISESARHRLQNVLLCRGTLDGRRRGSRGCCSRTRRSRRTRCSWSSGRERVRCCGRQADAQGGLSRFVATEHPATRTAFHFVLVDRQNSRRKSDVYLGNMGVSFERALIDIKDLDLDALLPAPARRLLVVGKHLCGAATCLALRALRRLAEVRPAMYARASALQLVGRSRCWSRPAATRRARGSHLSAGRARCASGSTGRASGCCRGRRAGTCARASFRTRGTRRQPLTTSADLPAGLDAARFGLRCKLFIDSARADYLAAAGGGAFHSAQIAEYVDASVSPENRALLAIKLPGRAGA